MKSGGILLVTADKELSQNLKASLRETDAVLTMECNGIASATEGFAIANAVLVIVDMFLPDGTGFELVKKLRKMDEDCLFLLLVRIRTRSAIDLGFKVGAQDVLHYPVNIDVIRDTILHRLESKSEEEEEEEKQAQKPAQKK